VQKFEHLGFGQQKLDRGGLELSTEIPASVQVPVYGPPLEPDDTAEPFFLFTAFLPLDPQVLRRVHVVELRSEEKSFPLLQAGTGTPTLKVTEPAAGSVQDDTWVRVAWSASDPDGDPLFFTVFYSPDGKSWWTVASELSSYEARIRRVNLRSSSTARFRVVATDGIHNATADSPIFVVPNRPPEVSILSPLSGTVVSAEDYIVFSGRGYDFDEGSLLGHQLQWASNRDGPLGSGTLLTAYGLSPGEHTITLRGRDGEGLTASDTVRLTVLPTPEDVEAEPDGLVFQPQQILLRPHTGEFTARLTIGNRVTGRSIPWSSPPDVPWLKVIPDQGMTPSTVRVEIVRPTFQPGIYRTSIRLRSPNSPTVSVPVTVEVHRPVGLPAFLRGDPNDDGRVDIADAVAILNCLFGGEGECTKCPDAADGNDDGQVNIADAVYLLSFLFANGSQPPRPFDACGIDPTPDELGSCMYEHCR